MQAGHSSRVAHAHAANPAGAAGKAARKRLPGPLGAHACKTNDRREGAWVEAAEQDGQSALARGGAHRPRCCTGIPSSVQGKGLPIDSKPLPKAREAAAAQPLPPRCHDVGLVWLWLQHPHSGCGTKVVGSCVAGLRRGGGGAHPPHQQHVLCSCS